VPADITDPGVSYEIANQTLELPQTVCHAGTQLDRRALATVFVKEVLAGSPNHLEFP
jgi:hypothetical protein